MSATSKRWVMEPLFAALLGGLALGAGVVVYSVGLAATRVEPSWVSASGDDRWQRSLLGLVVPLVVLVWVALAAGLNRVFRAETVARRLLLSVLAATAVTAPFAVSAVVGLWMSDGWSGLGMVGLLTLLAVPLLAVVLHVLALPLASIVDRGRLRREKV